MQELVKTDLRIPFGPDLLPSRGKEIGGYAPKKGRESMLSWHASGIPHWVWALGAWIAWRCGDEDKQGNKRVYYDDEEIIISKSPTEGESLQVDEEGICVAPNRKGIAAGMLKLLNSGPDYKKEAEILRALSEAWNLANQPAPTQKRAKP